MKMRFDSHENEPVEKHIFIRMVSPKTRFDTEAKIQLGNGLLHEQIDCILFLFRFCSEILEIITETSENFLKEP